MFENIMGYDNVKEELLEIHDILSNPKKYTERGARLPKGLLLIGSPGNGKTLFATELMKHVNLNSIVLNDYINRTDNLVSCLEEVFEKARESKPSIVFIDEFDKVFNNNQKSHEKEKALQQLLIQLDGTKKNEQVFVLALVNKKSDIDKVLLRSGRFDRTVYVNAPNKEYRRGLIEHFVGRNSLDFKINIEEIVSLTRGMSCADIENVVNEANLLSIRDDISVIDAKHINEAIDRVRLMSTKNNDRYSEDTLYRIAIHELGHAIVAATCKYHELEKVTIHQRGTSGGQTITKSLEETYISRDGLYESLKISLGGHVAESILLNNPSSLSSDDLKTFRSMLNLGSTTYCFLGLRHIHTGNRYSEYVSNERLFDKDQVEIELAEQLYEETMSIIKERISLIKILAKKLVTNEVLFAKEIYMAISNESLKIGDVNELQGNSRSTH